MPRPRPALALVLLVAAPTLVLAVGPPSFGGGPDVPHTFVAGTPARAAEVNENFAAVTDAIAALAAPAGVVRVATSGAEFTSVAAAVASVQGASAASPWLVRIGPGVFDETQPVAVPPFVRLVGAGAGTTVVRAEISAPSNTPAAAVLQLGADVVVERLTVHNTAGASTSTGVHVQGATGTTVLREVEVVVDGAGGLGHFAVSNAGGEVRVEASRLRAAGASIVNSALGSIDSGGSSARVLVRGSTLIGEGPASGIALQIVDTAADVESCRLLGDFRGVYANVAGTSRLRSSLVETAGSSPVFEQTGSAEILCAGVEIRGGNPAGAASRFKYVHCHDGSYDPIADGTGSDVE